MPSSTSKLDIKAATSFLADVEEKSRQNLKVCYQCRRCASGCPVGQETGVTPDRLIRLVLMGRVDEALDNKLVWKCLSCYTCGAHCPNNIQTASITEALKHMAKKRGIKPTHPKIPAFHSAFISSAGKFGRISEIDFMRKYSTQAAIDDLIHGRVGAVISDALNNARMGMQMMKNKRMHFGSEKIKGLDEIKRLYKKANK